MPGAPREAAVWSPPWPIPPATPPATWPSSTTRSGRSRPPTSSSSPIHGIEQEIYALLVTCQALRTAIADAASTVLGTDPDRASFASALSAARDQVILAAGVNSGPVKDLAGTIGRLVMASLMPARRLRVRPRAIKRAMSKYNARGKVDRTSRKATIDIAILAAPLTGDDDP